MNKIFKYTFLRRIPNIILYMAIMIGVSLVETAFLYFTRDVKNGFYLLWFVIDIAVLTIIPLSQFVKCANGYARELLFSDESYLFFTLPLRIERIVFGRMLMGFVEFVSYLLVSVIFLSIITTGWISHYMGFELTELSKFYFRLPQFVAKNSKVLPVLFLIFISGFVLLGNVTLFVNTAVKAFGITRFRFLHIIAGVAFFLAIEVLIGKAETFLGSKMRDIFSINVHGIEYVEGELVFTDTLFYVPVVSITMAFVLGAGLFFVCMELMRKRVEIK